MMASPSTTRPVSSARITRSASPSSARPSWAPLPTMARAIAAGWTAPQPSLMLVPSGSTASGMTLAPSSSNTPGATW